jgi:glucose/arabinose dehydrogenase
MPSLRARHAVATTILLIAGSLVIAPASAQDQILCFGQESSIEAQPGIPTVGTGGDDVIIGTDGPDVILGGAGDDLICGLSGADTIRGNAGSDRIDAGPGNDTANGGFGADEIRGGDGRDELSGDAGDDRIRGQRGRDTIRGGKGDDNLSGGAQTDEIAGKSGNDVINGGRGMDTLEGGRGRDAIEGGPGNDTIRGGPGPDNIDGGNGRDVCLSGQGATEDTRCLLGLELTLVAELGDRAGLVLAAPGDDDRLFVIEQYHGIRVIENGELKGRRFLNLEGQVATGNEQGVLGMAFHPNYAENGRFFVSYTGKDRDNKIVEYRVDSENPNRADADSDRLVIQVDQPHRWHNGGHITFGPDGYLYIGIGDGGPGDDPNRTGQDTSNLLAGISRIDVDTDDAGRYGIPVGNPFVGQDGRDELWAYGLRNPWRFSFDNATERMYVGDVGQFNHEEINVAPTGEGGINYGWSITEGDTCFRTSACARAGLHEPLIDLPHFDGTCSVIGGSVYRGEAIPELAGHYMYSDFCTRALNTFVVSRGAATQRTTWLSTPATAAFGIMLVHEPPPGGVPSGSVSSFGVDNAGELYMATIGGAVYKVEPLR